MAKYDYECATCGYKEEREHPIGEWDENPCPACGSVKFSPLPSSPAIVTPQATSKSEMARIIMEEEFRKTREEIRQSFSIEDFEDFKPHRLAEPDPEDLV